jgi:lysyl-tRNA synthetase class 1
MQWLNHVVDEVVSRHPDGEILIESGISPSGSYHMGYLREILTCDAVLLELRRRGRIARHVHFVDDQDGFRKVPAGVPEDYQKYLGQPLCDMPAPDGSDQSYADYALKPFLDSVKKLGADMVVIRSHEKYRQGFFVPAIELVLAHIKEARQVLEDVSGRRLGEEWSPIQVNEGGYLKKRPFLGIDTAAKTIRYLDKDGQEQTTPYDKGQVKLDWRLDWPARWWRLKVDVEPFGRDHATKGGSYDTGKALMENVFKTDAPLPIPYEFINRAGDTKKMSASTGDGIQISEVAEVLPPEIARYFVFRSPPSRTLFFDAEHLSNLIDDFAELLAKPDKTEDDKQLIELSTKGVEPIISNIPFSHLAASYQAALKNPEKTLDILARTEHKAVVESQQETIKKELSFIDAWLNRWAPDELKFELRQNIDVSDFNPEQKSYLGRLADRAERAPADADGAWFHKAIYDLKEADGLSPQQAFEPLYLALIGKKAGPRAGWFLSILPREWLVKRLKLEA